MCRLRGASEVCVDSIRVVMEQSATALFESAPMSWSYKYEKCLSCGTQATPHAGRGLCVDCYQSDIKRRRNLRRFSSGQMAGITRDNLERQYVTEGMSLGDLAAKYNCTRTYIHKLTKRFGINRRTQSQARDLALDKGKLTFTRLDTTGNARQVILTKQVTNKAFFKSWSPSMAYVLGVIFTDGNLLPSSKRDSRYKNPMTRISVAQKEPELLEKILLLMGSNAKIYRGCQNRTGNPIYHFSVNDEEIYDDLIALGLSPKKSRTICFPPVDAANVRHFLRGCWDGDGSVYFERGKPRASYVSGSKDFVRSTVLQLHNLGMPLANIYSSSRSAAYYFRFHGVACARLYHIFYDGVPEEMYLRRKYDRFRAIAMEFDSQLTFPLNEKRVGSVTLRMERTAIAELLGIAKWRVTKIMQSPDLRSRLNKLLTDANAEAILSFREEIEDALHNS